MNAKATERHTRDVLKWDNNVILQDRAVLLLLKVIEFSFIKSLLLFNCFLTKLFLVAIFEVFIISNIIFHATIFEFKNTICKLVDEISVVRDEYRCAVK